MKASRGFTLIELMIVVLVIAVLAGLAFSAYNNQVRKSRRAEAKQVLSDLALREEKHRSNNPTYGTLADMGATALASSALYYNVTYTAAADTAIGYTLTAQPKPNTDQAKDTCGTLTLVMASGTISKNPITPGCWQ